ncbi:hypothetical protein HY492_03195 [Candidatus Woesearchaeota archaeon]|nr:hypothetical protein [Candidatus Woesearchaeota archaeon]
MDERRRQLRRDMDSYLSQRRKSDWSFFKPALHPTVHPYKNSKEAEPMASEVIDEQPKKGWISGMVDKLFGAEDVPEDVSEEAVQSQVSSTDATADLKEVARISLAVMKRMDGDAIHEFKQTPDYDKFKEILRKHQLIK